MTVAEVVTPEALTKEVAVVEQTANAIVTQARGMQVTTGPEAAAATEFLAQVKAELTKSESARKLLVKPLNDHVKTINAEFKLKAEPLAEADRIVRERLIAFETVQEQERLAEQARIQAEREAAEAEAAERARALQDEADRQRQEAAAAERARLREIAEQADERRKEIAALTDSELQELIEGEGDDVDMAVEELAARAEAKAAADLAQREADAATQAAIVDSHLPVAPVMEGGPRQSASGSASTVKRWVGKVLDPSLVPREYMVIDQKAINAAVKAGVRVIPGVLIEQETGLAVRAGS